MACAKDPPTPTPPLIGKIGPYTVFLSPPSPKSADSPTISDTPNKVAPVQTVPPPVQPPPAQFINPADDRFGFFRNAVSKAQNVHASVDEYMAHWLGLNQSKYQWALDDYYEARGLEKGDVITREVSTKSQTV